MEHPNLSLVLRPLRGYDDAEAIYRIMSDSAEADQLDPYSTLEGSPPLDVLRQHLNTQDPALYCVAELNSQVVGYNRVIWWEENNELWLYLHLGQVLPSARGHGVGTALLQWSEDRIRHIVAEQPRGTAIFGANASSTEIDSTQLLLNHGYKVVFTVAQMHFDDFDSLSPVTVPSGMRLREPQPDDATTMRICFQAAWAKGIFGVSIETDEQAIGEIRNRIEKEGGDWRIIAAGDVVAGQIWCSWHEHEGVRYGVVDELNVHPDFRQQGIAQALMIDTLARFHDAGASLMRLHTDDGNRNGAKSLYEKVGFRRVKTFPRYRKSLTGPS